MNYRRLGKAGLKLSELSLGAWVTYGGQVGEQVAYECMVAAYDAGVNFFDNAEAYADGNAEIVMGNVLKKIGWRRESYVVSTKIFWGGHGPNDSGLSYKHIVEGVNNALRRLPIGLRRPGVLPPARPRNPHRGNRAGHGPGDPPGQGLLLGHLRVERGRDHARRWRWRARTGCARRAWSSRSTTSSSAGASRWSTPPSTATWATARPSGARWLRVC